MSKQESKAASILGKKGAEATNRLHKDKKAAWGRKGGKIRQAKNKS